MSTSSSSPASSGTILAFRDYLRAHPDVAYRYADLKRELISRQRDHSSPAYAEGKAAFIADTLQRARQ
jgi:GrpB-like predicted nucleotidyltransferase (UPF0157 family)